jgi:NAD(P)-dependent dehydrogenase (short-subunit alcohol dehydrogenase family)
VAEQFPTPDLLGLAGTVTVVTGGAQGIGEGIVSLFVDAGSSVVVADINGEGAERVAAAARERGGVASSVEADIRTPEGIMAMVAAADLMGGADALVNNAGGDFSYISGRGAAGVQSLFDVDRDYFDACVELNLKATFFCCQAFARNMIDRGRGGSIVNITSFQGTNASPGYPVYGPVKAAIAQLTRTLAYELGRHGIRVNAVAPTFIESPRAADLPAHRREAAARAMPVGRTGSARDLAMMVLALSSPAFGYYTGHHIAADGGLGLTTARIPILFDLDPS